MELLAAKVSDAEGLAKPLTWQTVQQWEKATAPKRKRLEIVANLLGLSVSEMLGAGGVPSSSPQGRRTNAKAAPSLDQALDVVARALIAADDLTLDQVRPLLARLVDEPTRAPEIVPRLAALLAGVSE